MASPSTMSAEQVIPSPSSPSTTTSMSSRKHAPSLSIDLADLPPLTTPSAPSNTLLITNLGDPLIFAPQNLASMRTAIESQVSLYSFSPLRSFRRIVAVFFSTESAIEIRRTLDGETLMGHRIRVYFGEPYEIDRDQHLTAPKQEKMFFISPPPSPPCDWTMRNEDAPNKKVHAADLASALKKIDTAVHAQQMQQSQMDSEMPSTPQSASKTSAAGRSRSSTVVFDPADHGSDSGLPAIAVEDTGFDESEHAEGDVAEGEQGQAPNRVVTHTSRPPVELMDH